MTTRRLAAILAADVVGFSKLMGADEEGTLARVKALRRDLIDPKVHEHHGRVVKTTGDGFLIEFASPVEAVRCAVSLQEALAAQATEDTSEALQMRIGINLGDIIIEDDGDIYGDGVNVAARLEQLAEAGGVCVSGKVYEEVRDKLGVPFEDRGEQQVKNIARPVRVYARKGTVTSARESADPSPVPLPLPDKPSIAVLPFNSMGGDPEQEWFADGIVEDVITTLSKISELFVIARNSSFVFKNRPVDLREIAKLLGVRYVLEGSIRKGGHRIRVTAQLVDGKTGAHLWAERYDRLVEDVFDVQDEITREIATALQVRLTEGEQVELRRRQTVHLQAWENYARAQAHLRMFARADNAQARSLLIKALEFDPNFATAWAHLAWTYLVEGRLGWGKPTEDPFLKGVEAAQRGLSINEREADAWGMLAGIRLYQRRYEEALEGGQRSIELAPNAADLLGMYALTLNFAGRAQDGLNVVRRAIRLSPYYPDWYLGAEAMSLRLLGQLREAIAADLQRLERNPDNVFSDLRLAAAYVEVGDLARGRYHLGQAMLKNPSYSARQVKLTDPFRDEAEMERYLGNLRLAGLPD